MPGHWRLSFCCLLMAILLPVQRTRQSQLKKKKQQKKGTIRIREVKHPAFPLRSSCVVNFCWDEPIRKNIFETTGLPPLGKKKVRAILAETSEPNNSSDEDGLLLLKKRIKIKRWPSKNTVNQLSSQFFQFLFELMPKPIGNRIKRLCDRFLKMINTNRKNFSHDRKALISWMGGTNALLICALRTSDFFRRCPHLEKPHALSLFLFSIVFGFPFKVLMGRTLQPCI